MQHLDEHDEGQTQQSAPSPFEPVLPERLEGSDIRLTLWLAAELARAEEYIERLEKHNIQLQQQMHDQ